MSGVSTVATALVVEVPEADAVVGGLRQQFDRVALAGMPAHVTVLYPFLGPHAIDEAVLSTALDVIGDEPPFFATLSTVATFPARVAYLVPHPAEPFVRLTERLVEAFPGCLPYHGQFDSIVPHLTVGHAEDEAGLTDLVTAAEADLADAGGQVRTEVSAVALYSRGGDGRWTRRTRIPLGTADL